MSIDDGGVHGAFALAQRACSWSRLHKARMQKNSENREKFLELGWESEALHIIQRNRRYDGAHLKALANMW